METFYTFLATILFHLLILKKCSIVNSELIKGIPEEKAELYAFGKDFSCLDGTLTIPYSYINDDYCDCLDTSDEPGTSACSNGTFHCLNKDHLPLVIPSSRVNDGICDCCDGSDEWVNNELMNNVCQNMCKELNDTATKEIKRIEYLYDLGYEIRAQLIIKGKYLLIQKQNTIFKLLTKKKNALLIKNNRFDSKKIAESREKKAIDEEKLKEQKEAFKTFNEFDTNNNNKIEMEEAIMYSAFNKNKDGLVSPDEINNFMMNKREMDLKDFMAYGWNYIKLLLYAKSTGAQYNPIKINVSTDEQNQDAKYNNKVMDTDEINKLLYSEKTNNIINESKKALQLYEKADKKVQDLERTIYDLQRQISNDFGPENEFAALNGQCYDFIDLNYKYQLCLFEKATQRSIKEGSNVNLGVWNNWTMFVDNEQKYHTMLYNNGDICFESQKRFTYVHLSCGLKPKLLSVTEPNRCEYLMEFEVPSVCVKQDSKYLKEVPHREEL